jgi:Ca2+/Na+ antiporter
MIQSRKFVAAAILMGIALIIAGLLIAPFSASANAAASQSGVVADRIGAAFSTVSDATPDPALAAAAARLSKGDLSTGNCAGAVWPNIDASCLSTADGSPAKHVRTITIGYQSGENTTVLVRVPSGEVAQR